jgi:hypothetical protein
MPKKEKSAKDRLRASRVVDVPLREVSGICLRRGPKGRMALLAIGDHKARLAWLALPAPDDGPLDWQTISLAALPGSELPKSDPQIEAICADGPGRVLLLQESPPRAELIGADLSRVIASIQLIVEGKSALARSWSDPDGSRGEGAVLLAGGHLLIAKEKKPAALIEFGPRGARPRGLVRGAALAPGARWPIENGKHEFVALATWFPVTTLAQACDDFSDLEIGPDGRLYLLSDKSASIARIADLRPDGGSVACTATWRLEDLDGKPEGLAFDAAGRAVVALDKRKARNNLVLLEPAIAAPAEIVARPRSVSP